jgi:dihydropyrimidinase
MIDLLLKGGVAVLPEGPVACDIGIDRGIIVSITAQGAEAPTARTTVDTAEKLLIPGGIDPHIHASWLVPTAADERIMSGSPEQISRAAAFGGTTTLVDFATWEEGETLDQSIARKREHYEGNTYVDYALHCILRGDLPQAVVDQIPAAVVDGFPSFKVFMTQTTPDRPPQMMRLGQVSEVLERTSESGGILAVHAEDDDIVMFNYRRLRENDRLAVEHLAEAHNPLSEAVAVQRLIAVAQRIGGAVYFMHISSAEGVDVIRAARRAGLPIYAETLQHYLSFTQDMYARPDGALYHTYPSLKSESDRQELWRALTEGTLSTVATDEMCTTRAVKLRGTTIEDTTGGHAGVEIRVPLMYGESVVERDFSLTRFVDITSANAARILGMYPKKGALQVGSDADIAVLDTETSWTIALADLHETDYSIFEDWKMAARCVMTVVRGQIVMQDGELIGNTDAGRLVRRSIHPDIRTRRLI